MSAGVGWPLKTSQAVLGAVQDDVGGIPRHNPLAVIKKSIAGRARGDRSPPCKLLGGLVFWPASKMPGLI